jgi:hypothetical protein
MAATYTPIQTYTASGSQSSITFSSIPSTYTDLIMVFAGTSASTSNLTMQFNGDTASNYSVTRLYGTGTAAGSDRQSTQTGMNLGYVLGTGITNDIYQVFNYANTTTYKTAIGRSNNTGDSAQAGVGLWRSTAAITSITIVASGNFSSASTFTLYGIKAA